MIELNRILDSKFGNLNSPLQLVAIEDLALPVYKVFLECVGEVKKDLEPTTEYLLKFLELGVSTVTDLAGVMGLGEGLTLDLILAECSKGHVALIQNNTKVVITVSGRSLLKSLQTSIGSNFERTQIFDAHLWKIQEWTPSDFLTEKQMDGYLLNSPVRVSKGNNSRVEVSDISIVDLNRILSQDKRELKEVHLLRRIQRRVSGFKLAKLLIYFDGVADSSFAVIVDGKRSTEHEDYLQSIGGLNALNIVLDPVTSDEKDELSSLKVNNVDVMPGLKDLLTVIKPFEHPDYFNTMLEESRNRLVIMSPWITDESDDVFREKLEMLLKKKVQITIAYGYETRRNQKYKDSPEAIKALFDLSEKYANFSFRRFKNDNHGKVLISDDTIVIGSFNWLSYRGKPDHKTKVIRGEYSLMSSNSKVSSPLIEFFESEVISTSTSVNLEIVAKVKELALQSGRQPSAVHKPHSKRK